MNLYIYTDESGVFDVKHNKFFVFGGVLFLSKKQRDKENRKYINVENCIRGNSNSKDELKACKISNKNKGKIFRSLNNVIKFGVVIDQQKINKHIFNNKKSKQRYLDYAYKIMIKKLLMEMEENGIIKLSEIENINIYCDEHTTATNGKYELREVILQELKFGTFNTDYHVFYEPICPDMYDLTVTFCDSKNKALIRAADIVANKLYYHTTNDSLENISRKINIFELP